MRSARRGQSPILSPVLPDSEILALGPMRLLLVQLLEKVVCIRCSQILTVVKPSGRFPARRYLASFAPSATPGLSEGPT